MDVRVPCGLEPDAPTDRRVGENAAVGDVGDSERPIPSIRSGCYRDRAGSRRRRRFTTGGCMSIHGTLDALRREFDEKIQLLAAKIDTLAHGGAVAIREITPQYSRDLKTVEQFHVLEPACSIRIRCSCRARSSRR
jgi:hypothetical protein